MRKKADELAGPDRAGPKGALLVVCLLLCYAVASYSAALTKCNTFDEIGHLTNGYTFWAANDFRMIPEAVLVQRWLALPIYLGHFTAPRFNQPAWQYANDVEFADQFFYRLGNDAEAMLRWGRAMNLVFAVALGLLVYCWSASLHGTTGGLVSLVLFAFSPTVLAHGSLATTDMSAALCFTAGTWALWTVLHRLTPRTVLASSLSIGCFFAAKLSAVLMIPIGLILLAIRLIGGRPLSVALFDVRRSVADRARQMLWSLGLIAIHVVVAWAIVWTMFGFRFAMTSGAVPLGDRSTAAWWPKLVQQAGNKGPVLDWFYQRRLLPEGYLLAVAHTARFTGEKAAFLNGAGSQTGWRMFFPYCLLVKTPLPLFALLALSFCAATGRWASAADRAQRSGQVARGLYRMAPLLVWLAVYWAVSVTSAFNIGHRHILPTYPAMYILAGGAAVWLRRSRGSELGRRRLHRLAKGVTAVLLAAFVLESLWTWPNYLAYFNVLAGGSPNGYKHLVDSSLDWGQDLPDLKKWLDRAGLQDAESPPVYLAYFGTARPEYYGIRAVILRHGLPGYELIRTPYAVAWTGGVYCISATVLQSNGVTSGYGRWTSADEQEYRRLRKAVKYLEQLRKDPASRDRLAQQLGDKVERTFLFFDNARMGRLVAFLRQRRPDHQINYSILVYRLSDADVRQALFGPPPELAGSR